MAWMRDPEGTASTSRLVANARGRPTRPAACSWSGSLVFAAAKTSTRAPWRICAASSSEPAKDRRTSAGVKPWLQRVSASVSEAAAETVRRGRSAPAPPHPAASAAATAARATRWRTTMPKHCIGTLARYGLG